MKPLTAKTEVQSYIVPAFSCCRHYKQTKEEKKETSHTGGKQQWPDELDALIAASQLHKLLF